MMIKKTSKEIKTQKSITIPEMQTRILEKGEKLSKATKVRSLIQKQKGTLKAKQTLTDFEEPVLFLTRRDGKMEIFEKATAGKYVFEHSCGDSRYIELRPDDQVTFEYAGRRVRAYNGHEDRPYTGFGNPINDSESVARGYEQIRATDLKYQASLQKLKNDNKKIWVYIVLGIAGAIAIGAFAYDTWIQPAMARKAAADAANVVRTVAPTTGAWVALAFRSIKGRVVGVKL